VDPTKVLEADHRSVEALFAKIEKAHGIGRMPLIDELKTSLRGHMELEEEVLYQAMEPITGADATAEARTEHNLARGALDQLLGLAPNQPGFGAALAALKAGVEHHVEEEEGSVFPKLRTDASSMLARVATPFMHKRSALGMPIDPVGLAAASTKEELVAEARGVGIEKAGSMTKAKLADALVSEMR
jgi:iron-sulfur cluster repair protein YtfE (RIC family)